MSKPASAPQRAGITVFASQDETLRSAAIHGAAAVAMDAYGQTRALSPASDVREALAAAMRAEPDVVVFGTVRSAHQVACMSDMVGAGTRVICAVDADAEDQAIAILEAFGMPASVRGRMSVHCVRNVAAIEETH